MRVGSLCSGMGGLDLAVEAVYDAETAWHAEIDPHACTVLEKRWPGVPNLGDITAVDWSTVPSVDIICAGFPCQDISSAGNRAGIKEGTQSGLWFRVADAVRVLRPRVVVLENVGALIVRGLDVVLGDLAEVGYDARWACVRAGDIGAPHRRERVFILAYDGRGGPRSVAPDPDGVTVGQHPGGPPPQEAGATGGDGPHGAGRARPDRDGGTTTADTGRGRRDTNQNERAVDVAGRGTRWGPYTTAIRRWERILGRPAPAPTDDRGRLNPELPEWMMGLPHGWVTDLVPRRPALRIIGNGCMPQQAACALSLLDEMREVA